MGSRPKTFCRHPIFLNASFITALLMLVTACEQTPKTIFSMAEARWKQGDYLGAVQAYEHLVDDYPSSIYVDDSYYAIGTLEYLYLNDYPKAVEAFRKVVSDHPRSPLVLSAQQTLAEIYETKFHDHRLAVAEYQNLLGRTTDRAVSEELQYRIGEVYFDQGDFDQARSEWDQLIKQSPKSEWSDNAMYRTGSSYFLQGRYNEALATYLAAAKRYPDSDVRVEIRFWIANCYEELDRLDEALQEFRSLAGRYPNRKVIEVKIQSIENRLKSVTSRRPITTGRPAAAE
jgi:TolA-binding protein